MIDLGNGLVLLNSLVEKDPGMIIGPINKVLGFIINVSFDFLTSLGISNTLGFSIIILTIITRIVMLPFAFKSQKSMIAMQKLNPEIEKLKKKYPGKDPEVQQKLSAEIQGLYAKHKVNPFSGCLPLFLQLPIFFALSYLFRQSYLYISKISAIYDSLALKIYEIPNWLTSIQYIAHTKLPKGMQVDIRIITDMKKVLNKFTLADWSNFLSQIPEGFKAEMESLLVVKHQAEYFFGINLLEGINVDIFGRLGAGDNIGAVLADLLRFPAVMIPILVALTTFLSSYTMSAANKNLDENARMQQKTMTYMMPVLMFFMTFGLSAGVGVYWITSSAFQAVQQIFINKYYADKTDSSDEKIIDVKPKPKNR